MEKFRKLGIIEPVLKSIQEQKFEEPTEIQEKSIPLIMEGKDVIAGAATGSGKTLAFASVIIKTVERGNGIQALVLTPTRELAEQVSVTLQGFSKHKHLGITSVYGGVSITPQIQKLRITDVVVGTPGRILDHINRRTIDFENVKILVLDEADRMLDMGFKDDVERIIDQCPRNRQTLLFSATISRDISALAQRYMHNPSEVFAEAYVDPSKMKQVYYDVEDNMKFSLLVHFLKHEHSGLVMVFCNTQRNTDFVANNLKEKGINALAIHGGYSQDKRSRTMQMFHSQDISVLVCTDVAARGLDIKGVSHIYNYDIPKDDNGYIHRIGRTARAGKEGKVINILGSRDYENFQNVIRNSELNIEKGEVPEVERIFIRFRDNRSRGGFRSSGGFRGGGMRRGRSFGRGEGREHGRPGSSYRSGPSYRPGSGDSGHRPFYQRRERYGTAGRDERSEGRGGRREGRSDQRTSEGRYGRKRFDTGSRGASSSSRFRRRY